MSGARVTELLQSRGDPVRPSAIMRGQIAGRSNVAGHIEPSAPAAFPTVGSLQNLVYVTVGAYSQSVPIGPCWWGAEHGATLPAIGAECVIAFDNEGHATVVSWQGNHT